MDSRHIHPECHLDLYRSNVGHLDGGDHEFDSSGRGQADVLGALEEIRRLSEGKQKGVRNERPLLFV